MSEHVESEAITKAGELNAIIFQYTHAIVIKREAVMVISKMYNEHLFGFRLRRRAPTYTRSFCEEFCTEVYEVIEYREEDGRGRAWRCYSIK